MAHAAIELKNVNKWYGPIHALREINLTVKPGEVVVVAGPSGSGKSTMCRTINRLETIGTGTIRVNGDLLPQEGRDLARMRANVGMVFQGFNLFSHMSILDNVALGPRRVLGQPRREANDQARKFLDRVGILAQAEKYPAQLSGGQQQRAAIARTLAMQPQVILFDEPTSALDPEMVNEVLDVMVELASEGMTMMVVTHEMGFARRVAHKIVFMDAGTMIEESSPGEFFKCPKSERARDFIGKILQ